VLSELISVIVPVYNAEQHLMRCVQGILEQTYGNLEVILINDGSQDKSGTICDALAKSDDRVKVIHKANGGASSTRNAGLDIAQGEFLTFVDSDDRIVDVDMYRQMYDHIKKTNTDICVCGFIKYYSGIKRNIRVPHERVLTPRVLWESFLVEYIKYSAVMYLPWNKLYKMNLIRPDSEAYLPVRFNETLSSCNDIWFTTECVAVADGGISFLDITPYEFITDNNYSSISKVGGYENFCIAIANIKEKMLAALPDKTQEIEKTINCQLQVGLTIHYHRAVIYGIKPKSRIKWKTVVTILRHSTSNYEKLSAVLMFFLPRILYRLAFKIYCKLA
jgi:glycosyltransferase involved in cell wall biosynthesis